MSDDAHMHNLITERINKFHAALVARGQIKPISPQQTAHENAVNRCREDQEPQPDQTLCPTETVRQIPDELRQHYSRGCQNNSVYGD